MKNNDIVVQPKDVTEFISYLVELGEAYRVEESNMSIKVIENDKTLTIPTTDDPMGPSLPLVIYYDKMPVGEFITLNPFSDSIEEGKELKWFWGSRELIMRKVVKLMFSTIITHATAKDKDVEDVSYGSLDIITEFKDAIDGKTMAEFNKLKPNDIIRIFYNKREKTAQVQCRLFDEETVASYKTSIRKKSWKVFQGIMEKIFGTDDFAQHFTHKAAGIAVPKCEAVLAVMAKAYAQMEEYLEKLLSLETNVAVFMQHLPHIEKYYHLTKFISGSKVVSPSPKKTNIPPWEVSPGASTTTLNPQPLSSVGNPPPAFTTHTPLPSGPAHLSQVHYGHMNQQITPMQNGFRPPAVAGPQIIPGQ